MHLVATQPQLQPSLLRLSAMISQWKAWANWQDQCATNFKKRALKYDADTHKANPFTNGANETEKAKLVKEHPDLVEQCKAEAMPVSFPVGKDFNLSSQGRIARTPKLAALFDGMRRHEQQFISEARAKAKADLATAQQSLKDLEAATIP
jgi:hypothetical protein